MRHTLYFCASTAVLLATGSSSGAMAQSLLSTSIPGINLFAALPMSFNPVTASPAQRDAYGVPPAPDAGAAPDAYAAWLRAVTLAPVRQAATVLATSIYNGPMSIHGVASPTLAQSAGWSGTSIVRANNPFLNAAVQAAFTIPTVQPAAGTCSGALSSLLGGASSYASQWIGIDGNGSPDVLQAGVLLTAQCGTLGATASYLPWIEWYPNSLTQVSSPAISPGDYVQVTIWAQSPTTAVAAFFNETTGVSASYQLQAPTGITLIGNSAEWIIEEPTVNSSPTTLADYTSSAWSGGVAWNYKQSNPSYYYSGQPASSSSGGGLQLIQMVNTAGKVISAPSVKGQDFLFFQAY